MPPKPETPPRSGGVPPLRVLLMVGPLRPPGEPDPAVALVERLLAGRHRLAGLVLPPGDRLWDRAGSWPVQPIPLPEALLLPRRILRERLATDPDTRATVRGWVNGVAGLAPEVGVVYYSNWIPPDLYRLPPHGFLNYHPGPLPELRGMEPDTMAILQGRRETWGTVHQVSEEYDDGPIFRRTARLRLSSRSTPVHIASRLADLGVPALLAVLDGLARGRLRPVPQADHRKLDATRARVRGEAVIRWECDTVAMIDRRRRAFLGQDIGVDLEAPLGGGTVRLADIEVHPGPFPGEPGQVLGTYRGPGPFTGAPIVRALDGVAVLLPAATGTPFPRGRALPLNRRTQLRWVRRSLATPG